eukprot:GFKZ01005934.1.p1 GENE.GFKZ01005934.1~~GFKZ01005934.1.p1  ORF type:complete len:453 (-),score=97.16 GFKZ01005934.1:1137-2495(-)
MRAFLPTPSLPIFPARTTRAAAPLCSVSRRPGASFGPFDDSVLIDDASSEQYLQMLLNSSLSPADLQPKIPPPVKEAKRPLPKRRSRRKKPQVSLSAVRDLKRGLQFGGGGSGRGALEETGTDLDDRLARAPNGLAGFGSGSEPDDYLQELLPLLAKAEREEEVKRMRTGKEEEMYDKICTAVDLFASMHRNTEKLRNLRPFKLREEKEEECSSCGGTGMTTCPYCKGEGFVDLGENGEKFEPKFENNTFTMPKKVMGSIYHCPLCGGLKEERCISCFGSGKVRVGEEQVGKYEAEKSFDDVEIEAFDFDSLIENAKDRIEVGADGVIVMRARKVKRTGRRPKKNKGTVEVEKTKRRRGRPCKTRQEGNLEGERIVENDAELSRLAAEVKDATSTRRRGPVKKMATRVGKTTDFVNTTDYKVGRRLARGSAGNKKKGPSGTSESVDTEAEAD